MRNDFPRFYQDYDNDIRAFDTAISNDPEQLADLLPRLAALSARTSQWITIIGASREVVEQLVAAGISRTRIRWVYGRDQDEREWATEQALLAGTSSIVLTWLGDLAPRMQQRLKMASKVTHTHSFVFNEAPTLTPLH